jgi:transcriptional regulator with XRE-family HTH domain
VRQRDQTDIKQRFGLAIKQRRHELGISQEELSFRVGLHRTYISDIERGSRNPSLENIAKLAKELEISVSILFANYGIEIEDSD